ncbi:MAG TPA: EamA family transporter [Solirubrobacteraceae bacterium]|jgi:drug/metabolite transporter (DMT)-like permease|nr:EamA family transporter [Solirubrobacteraceae bacterium]
MLALALALGSSACWGVSNFLGPQLVQRYALVSVLVLSQIAALGACALYLAVDSGPALPTPDFWLALLAGLGNGGGLIAFYRAAQLGPLSVVAPIGAAGAVVPVVWGLASGDSLRAPQAVGVVLAMGGAALAARRPPAGHSPARYPDPRAAAHWAAGSAVAFGVFLTALPKASAHGRAWALFDARLALVALLAIWAGRELAAIRLAPTSALLAVPGLLLVVGTVMYTAAADHGQLSLVSVLSSLFPVFTVGLGVALLGERLSRTQAVGVAAALTGIALIAL